MGWSCFKTRFRALSFRLGWKLNEEKMKFPAIYERKPS